MPVKSHSIANASRQPTHESCGTEWATSCRTPACSTHLTAGGNVSLLAGHLGWDRERIAGRLKELVDLARLPTKALERYPAELSGGQRQRVGLMRALMLDPAVLLMDEPLGALDPITRSQLQGDLRTIFRELNKTVVLVTRDLAETDLLRG